MPRELSLRFERLADRDAPSNTPIPVTVHYDGQDTEKIQFINPLSDQDLADLRWYIEAYCQWPVGPDYSRAHEIETRLPGIGRSLFNSIFKTSAEAMGLFKDFLNNRDADSMITIDTTEPRILRLPWELLAEEGGYMFSKNPAVSIRRRMHQTKKPQIRVFDLPVRILMVVSRPKDAVFIDPRSSARPLLDAVDKLGDRAVVEFLRPPTLAALSRRLHDTKLPMVHVVHFDGHGMYDRAAGLGVLLFESENYEKHLVNSERLGTLLNETGIPLMILDACQSGQPDESNPFGSVASRLIESGVGGVVAMNYSVLVETSKRLVRYFYQGLAEGRTVSSALDAARLELLADSGRIKLYRPGNIEETIDLQDWFVPALYQQSEELRPFSPQAASLKAGPKRVTSVPYAPDRGGFPPEPQHGFQGRSKELLDLERSFDKNCIEILHGFGGQGKTALGAYTARWLVRTGRFDQAVFVSFESGVGLEVVLAEMGTALFGKDFKIQEGEPIKAIAEELAKTPTLVVWDNFETILPEGSIPLSAEDLQELLEAGNRWFCQNLSAETEGRIPNSCLLVTTRNPDIPHDAFTPGARCGLYPLPGLNPIESLELAGSILANLNIPRPDRESLSQLLYFLGDHPLSIQLVIPHLGQGKTVEQLIDDFDALLPGFKKGKGIERNQSLEVSLQYSLSRLDNETRALLPRLSVFRGGAFEDDMLEITQIDAGTWQRVRTQLVSWSLIRVEHMEGINPPFLRFHPTLAPYLARQIKGDDLGQIETRYWQHYYSQANYLYNIDPSNPHKARAMANLDMPNLRRALTLAVGAAALREAADFAGSINRFLDFFGRLRERDDVNKILRNAVEKQNPQDYGPIIEAQNLMDAERIDVLLSKGQAEQAEQAARALLKELEAVDFDASYHQFITIVKIGRSLKAQGKNKSALEQYSTAMDYARTLEQSEVLRRSVGYLHSDLADALVTLGQYGQARENYEKAIEISQSQKDYRGAAVVSGQLGNLALTNDDLSEANRLFNEALKIFQGLGEAEMEAVAWHQLGLVANRASKWEEAERCFSESLRIKERLEILLGQASTCNMLGLVAKNAGRPGDAERWFKRAIELYKKTGARGEMAIAYSNLVSRQDNIVLKFI